MNQASVRRRSVVSVLLGAVAMVGSFAVMGVLVLSDVADAKAPRKPVQVARVEQKQLEAVPTQQAEDAQLVEPEEKPLRAKKRGRTRSKVDFGRFEGY